VKPQYIPITDPVPDQQLVYTIPEIIRILRISRASLYRLLNRGELKSKMVGGRRLVTHRQLTAFLEAE
jgi:excisionase family DNA binding protein